MINFPILRVVVATLVIASSSFSWTVVRSFQPFMVNWFFPRLSKEELGWRTGYLGMSECIGRFFGGLFWGWLADNCGRRSSLLIALTGCVIFEILTGLSQNYLWALFGMLCRGFVGSIGWVVIRPYISEAVDEKHQPIAFSMYGICIGMGRIFGPFAGGFLAQPAEKYEIFDNHFFRIVPFIGPVLLSGLFMIMNLIGVYFVFEETLTKRKSHHSYRDGSVKSKSNGKYKRHENTPSDDSNTDDERSRFSSLDKNDVKDNGCCVSTYQHIITVQKDQLTCLSNCISGIECSNDRSYSPPPLKEKIIFNLRAIFKKSVLSSIVVFSIVENVSVMIFEVLILLIISDKKYGGYKMNGNSIGICFLVAGIVEMLYQLLLYSNLVKLFGWRKVLIGGLAVFAVATFIFPWTSSIPMQDMNESTLYHENQSETNYILYGSNSSSINDLPLDIGQQPYLVWIIVPVALLFLMIGRITSVVTSSVLLNNSSIPETRGTVNGIGFAFGSLLSAAGCVSAATVFAWSQNNGKGYWPLNYHFSFILLSILLIAITPIALSFPKSLETTKN